MLFGKKRGFSLAFTITALSGNAAMAASLLNSIVLLLNITNVTVPLEPALKRPTALLPFLGRATQTCGIISFLLSFSGLPVIKKGSSLSR